MKLTSTHYNIKSRSKLINIVMAIACALLLAVMIPATASAASTTVNAGQSIQSAINAASSGDVINIMPGTYSGSLTISKSITLQKASGASGNVVINGNGATNVITVTAGNVTLNGLNITNSDTSGIYFSGSGCTNDKVLNCNITEWGVVSSTDTSQVCGGIKMDGGNNLTVQGSYFQRGNHGGCSLSAYGDDAMNWYCIIIMHSSGGHKITGNTIWGVYTNGVPNICDSISNDDWNQANNSFNNSTISSNIFYGAWDEEIQVDGNNNNITIENNYFDGYSSRAMISTNPCYNGPVYIKNNILKNWSEVCLKWGAFTGSPNGAKYVSNNIAWNGGSASFIGSTNGSTSGGAYVTNNKIYASRLSYGVSFAQESGNTNSSFAEPTLSSWNGGTAITPTPTPTTTPTPTVTPTPTPSGSTFGLNSGESLWSADASVLNAMRFQNTVGSGTLNKLELQVSDSTTNGKVRLGVYADNAGKPGSRLLDAGEATVTNGWVSISGLNLPVIGNAYYWLAFNLQNTNDLIFLCSTANTAKIPHYWTSGTTYGALPSTFNLSGVGNNLGPYVMRATVTTGTVTATRTFGLSSGNNTWDQSANILDAMRFQNTAGSGTLNKLELLISDSTPTGKVRFGVYADNAGKPGNRLLDAGEATVTNGWVSISNLNLTVSSGSYYWLVFVLQNGNTAKYQSGQAASSHYWTNYTYATLPGAYPTTNLSTNSSPYTMRASVAAK